MRRRLTALDLPSDEREVEKNQLENRDVEFITIIIFTLAVLGGLTLASIRISGRPRPPTWLAIGHGIIALTGVALLSYLAITAGIPQLAQVALAVFVLAALGGLVMFVGFHLQEKALPIPIVLGHGLLAITGFILLLIAFMPIFV